MADDEIVDGVETPLGQHLRWLRQAPDLFERLHEWDTQVLVLRDMVEELRAVARMTADDDGALAKGITARTTRWADGLERVLGAMAG